MTANQWKAIIAIVLFAGFAATCGICISNMHG